MHGETILCVANRVWNSLWRDSQNIMSRIAQQNRVLYLEPGRDPDKPALAEMWRNLPNFVNPRTQILHKNLIIIQTPSTLPVMRRHLPRPMLQITTPCIAWINTQILIKHIRRIMKSYNVQAPILWLYSPYDINLVGKFNEKISCYYNYDEHSDFLPNRHVQNLLHKFDNQLTSLVNVVFATSRSQYQRRLVFNTNTYFIPNGVDFDLFNRALMNGQPLPIDIAALKRPIIGFAGYLGYYIDTELLLRVAKTFPECSLALVGPDELPETAVREQLRAQPNVFLLGRKNLEQLPDYLKGFDVALIPYLLEGHVLSAYPMKLQEYLAAGRAVVAVNLQELKPYRHVVRIAETHDEFIELIREALHEHDPEAIAARVAVARDNTWDQRVDEIYHILRHHLPS
jgi:glycosyltransferase involved in cell wall biosynthesis